MAPLFLAATYRILVLHMGFCFPVDPPTQAQSPGRQSNFLGSPHHQECTASPAPYSCVPTPYLPGGSVPRLCPQRGSQSTISDWNSSERGRVAHRPPGSHHRSPLRLRQPMGPTTQPPQGCPRNQPHGMGTAHITSAALNLPKAFEGHFPGTLHIAHSGCGGQVKTSCTLDYHPSQQSVARGKEKGVSLS